MFTVIETAEFEKRWPLYWTENEHDAFAEYIADNPNAGDVIRAPAVCAKYAGPVQVQVNRAV